MTPFAPLPPSLSTPPSHEYPLHLHLFLHLHLHPLLFFVLVAIHSAPLPDPPEELHHSAVEALA